MIAAGQKLLYKIVYDPKLWYFQNSLYTSRKMTSGARATTEHDFESIRQLLCQFSGGEVRLTKNLETAVATIVLNHPQKRNAMSGAMMVELRDCVEELEKWKEGKAVILRGNGHNFCSGGDLNFVRASANSEDAEKMATWMQDALIRLNRLPIFSVCLIHGPCLGGGSELSVFCDFIVASDDVKYGFVHGKMGIIPAWGGATRLAMRIGQRKALDLMLTAKILTAKECVDFGIAECIVPADEAVTKLEDWLSSRLQHHYTITRAMKEEMTNFQYLTLEESFRREKHTFAPFWGGELNLEALAKNIKHVSNHR